MIQPRYLLAILLLIFGAIPRVSAETTASLDRDHVMLGGVVMLVIESDRSKDDPDLSPLRKDFDVRAQFPIDQTVELNGVVRTSKRWVVTLVARHAGLIDIPALVVGREKTPPLRVGVDSVAGSVDGSAGNAGSNDGLHGRSAPVFIENSIEPGSPYVQQSLLYVVRVYFSAPLMPDTQFNVPPPDNGELRQLDNGVNDSVMVQGHRYDVVERHYLLRPEHSGTMHIPAPTLRGSGNFEEDSGFSVESVHADGKPIDVQVRPRPAGAGDPWLPAHSISLQVDPPTTALRAGEPFSIVVHLAGEGVTAAQLPEIAMSSAPGAQIYPEPSSTIERLRDGKISAERTRKFAIVPERAGELHLPDMTMPWWSVIEDHMSLARATLPAFHILPGALAAAESGRAPAESQGGVATGAATSMQAVRNWQIATSMLGALLVLSLAWGWKRGRIHDVDGMPDDDNADHQTSRRAPTLDRALAHGDPALIAQALCEAAPGTRPRNLDEVSQRLQDPSQRDAVQQFDAARWTTDGKPAAPVLARLREAFARPPRWIGPARSPGRAGAVPPLYPQ